MFAPRGRAFRSTRELFAEGPSPFRHKGPSPSDPESGRHRVFQAPHGRAPREGEYLPRPHATAFRRSSSAQDDILKRRSGRSKTVCHFAFCRPAPGPWRARNDNRSWRELNVSQARASQTTVGGSFRARARVSMWLPRISPSETLSSQALKDLPTPFPSSSIWVSVLHVIGSEAGGRVEESMGRWTGARARQRSVVDDRIGRVAGGRPSATR